MSADGKTLTRVGLFGCCLSLLMIVTALVLFAVAIWTHDSDTGHRLVGSGALLLSVGLIGFAVGAFMVTS